MVISEVECLKHFGFTEDDYLRMLSSMGEPIYIFKDGVGFYTDGDGGACVFNPSEMFEGEVSICLLGGCSWVDIPYDYLTKASEDISYWYDDQLTGED